MTFVCKLVTQMYEKEAVFFYIKCMCDVCTLNKRTLFLLTIFAFIPLQQRNTVKSSVCL